MYVFSLAAFIFGALLMLLCTYWFKFTFSEVLFAPLIFVGILFWVSWGSLQGFLRRCRWNYKGLEEFRSEKNEHRYIFGLIINNLTLKPLNSDTVHNMAQGVRKDELLNTQWHDGLLKIADKMSVLDKDDVLLFEEIYGSEDEEELEAVFDIFYDNNPEELVEFEIISPDNRAILVEMLVDLKIKICNRIMQNMLNKLRKEFSE